MVLNFKGELEIDINRGVIYFHNNTGYTVLRICGLKIPQNFGGYEADCMDITLKYLDTHPVTYITNNPIAEK